MGQPESDAQPVGGKLPEPGQIRWCYFPFVDAAGNLTVSGGAKHLVMVLANAKDAQGNEFLVVAGGTSATDSNGTKRAVLPTDFFIDPSDVDYKKHGVDSQMKTATKFSHLRKDILLLPYTRRWFYTPPERQSPWVGRVDFDSTTAAARWKKVAKDSNASESVMAEVQRLPT